MFVIFDRSDSVCAAALMERAGCCLAAIDVGTQTEVSCVSTELQELVEVPQVSLTVDVPQDDRCDQEVHLSSQN